MSLEPMVLERIKHHRKAIQRLSTTIATSAVIGLILSFASFTYALYFVAVSDELDLGEILMPVAIGVGLLIICWTIIYLAMRRINFESHFMARKLDSEQYQRLARFVDGLQGSSLAVGTKAPPLRVVDIKGVSTLSITLEDESLTVILTLDVLDVGLTRAEAEAIMAHELSHILIGEEIHFAARSRFDAFMWSALVLIITLFITSIMLFAMAGSTFAWLAAALCGIIGLLFFGLVPKFLSQRHSHDDLLADSIAAKITNNPGALKSAISKFARFDMLGMVLTSIFNRSYSPFSYRSLRNALPINKEKSIAMVPIRIENLEAIENGHWPVLEEID